MAATSSSFAPGYTPKDARAAGQSYQHLAHIVDRILNQVLNTLDETTAHKYFKASLFSTVHALHGFFNGRDLKKKDLIVSAQFVAPHFHYHGNPENATQFIGRHLDTLADAEFACGRRLIEIKRADNVTLLFPHYQSHPLLDAAQTIYQRARNNPKYWANPSAAVTDELIAEAIDMLPEVEPSARAEWQAKQATKAAKEASGEGLTGDDEKFDSVLKGRWTRWRETCADILADETFKGGRNPVLVLREKIKDLQTIADELYEKKCRDLDPMQWKGTGKDWIGDETEAREEEENDGYNNVPHVEPEAVVAEDATPLKNDGGSKSEVTDAIEVSEAAVSESNDVGALGAWALRWADIEVPVVPLHEVHNGICTCSKGSECKTAGKHPRTKNGVDDATTDPEQIRKWWKKWPRANIGGAMGGELRWLAVDVDPRNGGDANLYSFVEAHGDEWLDTLNHKTGSGGDHFFYTIPEGVEFTKGKLAKGIDLKWTGGLVVLPPSAHLSGNSYAIKAAKPVAPAPAWLLEELTRAADVPPSVPVDLQERRQRSGSFGTRRFSLGERNDGLRDVACGRWRHGFAADAAELYEQMREVRDTRCEFVAGDPPPDDSWLYDLVQRTVRKYARGDLKQEATA